MIARMRTILCQLGCHWSPRSLAFNVSCVSMTCDHCGDFWCEDWTDWQGLYLNAPRGPKWPG